jgi:hypothetical protein
MDQNIGLTAGSHFPKLRDLVIASVDAAPAFDAPFRHLELERVFPDEIYAACWRICQRRLIIGRCMATARG